MHSNIDKSILAGTWTENSCVLVKFCLKYNLLLLSGLIVGVTNGGKSWQAGKKKNVGKLPTVRLRKYLQ